MKANAYSVALNIIETPSYVERVRSHVLCTCTVMAYE